MFKFASAYGLARFHRCRFYLDEPYMKILNATFTINITFLNILKSEYLTLSGIGYRDNTACHYSQKLMLPNSIRYLELTGYWQAYRYFINYTDELRQQFTFRPNIIQTIAPFILQELKGRILCQPTCIHQNQSNIKLENIETTVKNQLDLKNKLRELPFTLVGIHWRRGDMMRPNKQAYGHTVSSFIYLQKAMNYFLEKYTNVLFIVTSDEKNYCKNIFSNNSKVIITPNKFTGEQDLAMLTVCQHTIVTSGTFGWFAAYLAGGDILYDKLSPAKNSGLERDCPPSQYYPPEFIPMRR
ncbi:unnamed protein product [Adineta steineri]|uniref:L-Fucosyltransferase n=1 Tax=Adineta steineri TaxID=433720 RepID=A0A814MIU8_9BILA|nr:unnamed protein product [Adineta steineri]